MSCPACGGEIADATSLQEKEARPKIGDFSVCVYCAELLRFTAVNPSLRCRLMVEHDVNDIDAVTFQKLKLAQMYILEIIENKKKKKKSK